MQRRSNSLERPPLSRHFDGMACAADLLTAPSLSNVTVQVGPGGGTQGMDPMHLPAAPDIPGMGHLDGDRR